MLHVEAGPSYWLTDEAIEKFKEEHQATFMGTWCIKNDGDWTSLPVDVFYTEQPSDLSPSNYFGVFFRKKECLACDAESAFIEPLAGIIDESEIHISRYKNDVQVTKSGSIGGGRDQITLVRDCFDKMPDMRTVIVDKDKFIVTGAG